MLLFDGGSAPLAAFGPKLSAKVEKTLDKLGVEMHMGSIVTDIDIGRAGRPRSRRHHTRYEVGTVLWTAGVEAPAFAEGAGGGDRGRTRPGGPHRSCSRT